MGYKLGVVGYELGVWVIGYGNLHIRVKIKLDLPEY
jgi:hypothetical protein